MKAVDKIEENLDQILGIQRIEANGVKLTPVEKAHVQALRDVALARIAIMRGSGIDQLLNYF